MNWYKQAISEKDFYRFYAYSGLSEEDLKQNPVFLYEMIEHLNYIRKYYLDYLIEQIGEELMHADLMIDFENDEKLDELKKYLRKLRENFYFCNSDIKNKLIQARDIFSDYKWAPLYGGYLWSEITQWTLKLYKTEEIPQEKYSPGLFNKIYKTVMILDTIHSLEHNTNNVLVDLPEKEYKWMRVALEIAKNSSDFYDIAKLSQDKNLVEYFSRERIIQQKEKNETIDEIYINNISKFLNDFINIGDEEKYIEKFEQLRIFLHKSDKKYFNYFIQAALKIDIKQDLYDNLKTLLNSLISKDFFSYKMNYILKDIQLFKNCIELYEKIDSKNLFLNMLFAGMKNQFSYTKIEISKKIHDYLLYRNENYRKLLKIYPSHIRVR